MVATKYGKYVKAVKFTDPGKGCIRQQAVMDGKFLGLDVHIQYGACWSAGKLGQEPYKPCTHDFDQLVFFLGTDMNDLSELNAEVEMSLGEELETRVITTSTAIAIPKGMPYLPATINRMDKRLIYMVISLAPVITEKLLKTERKPSEPVYRAKYGKNVMPMTFRRKAAWHYGPKNRDDGGGHVSIVRGGDAGINFTLIYESMKKAPYRLAPEPDKPHAHANSQVMLFLGSDPDDLSKFGGEFEICMGKEEERHTFSVPTAVITQPFVPHWPGGAVKLDRPILMLDIHPGGDSVVSQVKK